MGDGQRHKVGKWCRGEVQWGLDVPCDCYGSCEDLTIGLQECEQGNKN